MEDILQNQTKKFFSGKSKIFNLKDLAFLGLFFVIFYFVPTLSQYFLGKDPLSFDLHLSSEVLRMYIPALIKGGIAIAGIGVSVLLGIFFFLIFRNSFQGLQNLIPKEGKSLVLFKLTAYAIFFVVLVLVLWPIREGLWLAKHVSFY